MIRVLAKYIWAVAPMLLWFCPLHAAHDANLVQNGGFERDADRDCLLDETGLDGRGPAGK